jgi:Sec-independent protein translocase protein TatA
MGGIGISEVLIIMFLFGARRLPGIARSLGSSIFELKKALDPEGFSREDVSPKKTQFSADTLVKKE